MTSSRVAPDREIRNRFESETVVAFRAILGLAEEASDILPGRIVLELISEKTAPCTSREAEEEKRPRAIALPH